MNAKSGTAMMDVVSSTVHKRCLAESKTPVRRRTCTRVPGTSMTKHLTNSTLPGTTGACTSTGPVRVLVGRSVLVLVTRLGGENPERKRERKDSFLNDFTFSFSYTTRVGLIKQIFALL